MVERRLRCDDDDDNNKTECGGGGVSMQGSGSAERAAPLAAAAWLGHMIWRRLGGPMRRREDADFFAMLWPDAVTSLFVQGAFWSIRGERVYIFEFI